MLSPLVALNRDAFVVQDERETTVDLAGRHAASSLDAPAGSTSSLSLPGRSVQHAR